MSARLSRVILGALADARLEGMVRSLSAADQMLALVLDPLALGDVEDGADVPWNSPPSSRRGARLERRRHIAPSSRRRTGTQMLADDS